MPVTLASVLVQAPVFIVKLSSDSIDRFTYVASLTVCVGGAGQEVRQGEEGRALEGGRAAHIH